MKFNNHISKEFDVKTRLKQKNALFSMLFNIVLESVDRGLLITDAEIRIQNKKINLIAYVDDIVVIDKT